MSYRGLENTYRTKCISPKTEASATLSAKNPTWNNDIRSLLCLLLPAPVGRFAFHNTSVNTFLALQQDIT